MDKSESKKMCTSDAPCPERGLPPSSMLGREYRAMAHPQHVEFSPIYEEDPPSPEGWSRVDGLKKLDDMDVYVVSCLYRKHIGTKANGDDVYFVGEYVGNRRHAFDNDNSPTIVGSTWQIYLQEDPELDTPIACYRLCDLEAIDRLGTKLVSANDYKPDRPQILVYYAEEAPPKPELGLKVEHPQYGGGVILRVTGTGDVWYASVQYDWQDTSSAPDEGVSVFRRVVADGGKEYLVYGAVAEINGDEVIVEFDNGREYTSTVKDFYSEFTKIVEVSSKHFHNLFGLDRGRCTLTPKARRIGPDPRTANERIMGATSRSSVAFSALIARNTPDSGHFVPMRRDGPWRFRPDSTFRWHRERQEAPKNEDFAPLVGRRKGPPRPKKGWSYDRLHEVRERLALSPAAEPEVEETTPEPLGPLWDRPAPPPATEPVELTQEELDAVNGRVAFF